MNATRITNVTITPVAFRDPPLLNAVGVHEPFAIRSILEVETSERRDRPRRVLRRRAAPGTTSPRRGGASWCRRLRHQRDAGHCRRARSAVRSVPTATDSPARSVPAGTVLRTFAAFEVAALDIQGKLLGRPVGRPARRQRSARRFPFRPTSSISGRRTPGGRPTVRRRP